MKFTKPNTKTRAGMTSLQEIFSDKENIIRGLTKFEFISLYFNIPLDKVLVMNVKTIHERWNEITNARKYLRNRLHYAIEFITVDRGIVLENKEFGRRILKSRTNIFFRVVDKSTAHTIAQKYYNYSISYRNSGDNVLKSSEEAQEQLEKQEIIKSAISIR